MYCLCKFEAIKAQGVVQRPRRNEVPNGGWSEAEL